MGLKKFHQFSKLPLEIRRRIWNLSFAPRLIRARNESHDSDDHINTIYRLDAGPVPRLLHVHHESRTEGLRIFTMIASHVPYFNTEKTPLFALPSTRKIFVDLERDTFYLVTIQSSVGFLTWLRRLGNPKFGGAGTGEVREVVMKVEKTGDDSPPGSATHKPDILKKPKKESPSRNDAKKIKHFASPNSSFKAGQPQTSKMAPSFMKFRPGNGIRNIAFPASLLLDFRKTSRSGIDFLLSVAMLQPQLTTIGIVLDYSKFESSSSPEKYELKNAALLDDWLRSGATGGRWGTRLFKIMMTDVLEEFWTRDRGEVKSGYGSLSLSQFSTTNYAAEWVAWIGDEKRRDGKWKSPGFVMLGLGKVNGNIL